MNKIVEALKQLDTSNDNHWTADGFPKMEFMKFKTGIPDLTRADINEAAPEFCRSNPVVNEPEVKEERSADPDLHAQLQQQMQPPVTEYTQGSNGELQVPNVDGIPVATSRVSLQMNLKVQLSGALKSFLEDKFPHVDVKELEMETLQDMLKSGNETLQELQQCKSVLDRMHSDFTKRVDSLIEEIEHRNRHIPVKSVQQMYLESQASLPQRVTKEVVTSRYPVDNPRPHR
ncbi:MAG: hypothetical protein RR619_02725 [Raoultibacter sp.]